MLHVISSCILISLFVMKLLTSSSLSLGGLGLYIYAGVVYIDGLMGGLGDGHMDGWMGTETVK